MLHPVAQHRELVDQRDVDRAEDVLEQLRHLGGLRGRNPKDLVADQLIERDRALAARLGQPADDLRCGRDRVVDAAGSMRSGEKARWKSRPRGKPGLLEDRQQALAGGAGIGGRLEHHELTLAQHGRERSARFGDIAEVGLTLVGQRCRHADHHRFAARERTVVGGRLEPVGEARQALVGDVLDLAVPGGEGLDRAGVDVDADHFVARFGERRRQRQPDVSEPDHPNLHREKSRRALGACVQGQLRDQPPVGGRSLAGRRRCGDRQTVLDRRQRRRQGQV